MIENVREYLQNELDKRKSRNSQFSLRAFAKNLDISAAQLSQILSGKRALTIKTAQKVTKALQLSPLEKEDFLSSVNPESLSRKKERLSDDKRLTLKEDQFKLICDWPHYAVLSLSEIKNNSSDARWIARHLGIQLKEAAEVRDRLLRMGLIQIEGKGFRQIAPPLATNADVKSESIQRSHFQNLTLAQDKLDSVDVSEREYTTVTMAANPKKMKEAKKIIKEFKRKITELLEEGEPTEFYTFAVQLFPLTRMREKK